MPLIYDNVCRRRSIPVSTILRKSVRIFIKKNKTWFQEACQIAEKLGITVQKPRTCQVQHHRANTPAETIEDHYRRNLTIPLVDHLINELENRFGSGDQETAVQCLFAVSSMLLESKETWMTSFGRFSTFHEDSLPSPLSVDPKNLICTSVSKPSKLTGVF